MLKNKFERELKGFLLSVVKAIQPLFINHKKGADMEKATRLPSARLATVGAVGFVPLASAQTSLPQRDCPERPMWRESISSIQALGYRQPSNH